MYWIYQIFVFLIVSVILAFSCFLLYLIYWDDDVNNNNNTKYENFETDRPQPEDIQSNKCENNNIDNICVNNKACCSIPNNSYFCKHPVVNLCSTELQNCLDKTDFDNLYPIELRKEKCKNQIIECCKPFDKIKFDSSKFENMGNIKQRDNLIGTYLEFDEKKRTICPKMCATDSTCAAYVLSLGGCHFYSSVNPIVSTKFGQATPNIDSSNKTGYFKKL